MRRSGVVLAALSASALSSGCAMMAVGAAATAGMMVAQDRTPGEEIDDAAISQKVKARLLAFDSAAFSQVDVEVALRQVLLTGVTPREQDRQDAERIAWGVKGVGAVANQINVGPAQRLAGNAHDEWVTARVRAKLLADRAIKGINYNIETHQGVVYLMGVARTDEEARRVAEATSYVSGVNKVVSYVEVQRAPPGRPVDTGAAPIETPGADAGSSSVTASVAPVGGAY